MEGKPEEWGLPDSLRIVDADDASILVLLDKADCSYCLECVNTLVDGAMALEKSCDLEVTSALVCTVSWSTETVDDNDNDDVLGNIVPVDEIGDVSSILVLNCVGTFIHVVWKFGSCVTVAGAALVIMDVLGWPLIAALDEEIK